MPTQQKMMLVVPMGCPQCKRVHGWTPKLAGKEMTCSCGLNFRMPSVEDEEDNAETMVLGLAPASDELGRPLSDVEKYDTDVSVRGQLGVGAMGGVGVGGSSAAASSSQAGKAGNTKRWVKVRRAEAEPDGQKPDKPLSMGMLLLASMTAVVVIVALMVGLWAMLIGPDQANPGERNVGTGALQKPLAGQDKEVQEAIETYGAEELRAWLAQGGRRQVQGMSTSQASLLADKLYGLGSVRVLAFGTGLTRSLAVELPESPAVRAKIFEEVSKRNTAIRAPTPADAGQRYVILYLPL